ncbi:MAG: cysteine--tRNA ligase [Pirellulaceae bacterium]|nr:MAG: cysteine--tRNA ligase [Pirellulaceae bacterium]
MANAAPEQTNQSAPKVATTIRVYNTLTRKKEPFETVEPGKVGMYLCGPTVYAEAHIGHMVGPVIFDTIKRHLVYSGYEVTWVVNITDVDDKLIAAAQKRGVPMSQLAVEMTMDYLANLQALGVNQINYLPRATDNIDEIIRFISELVDKGYAYVSDGDVFFDVTKDAQYGVLSNRSADSQVGEGGEAATKKRSPMDFALWKAAKPGEPSWSSPWGPGRPGWHIECSAMARRYLGKTFDIHGGGLDLVFPHHENELAQSRCCHGTAMVRYWIHNGLMQRLGATSKLGGRGDREEPASNKISRSAGDGGLAQLIQEQTGDRIRFFLLRTHYRSTILFGDEPLAEAGQALNSLYRLIQRFARLTSQNFYETVTFPRYRYEGDERVKQWKHPLLVTAAAHRQAFLDKMDDDFNTAGAISELFELARAINRFIDAEALEDPQQRDPAAVETLVVAMSVLRELGAILGLFLRPPRQQAASGDAELVDGLMKLLLQLRTEARGRKDFATSDAIRDGLAALGITLQDLKDGTTWERKS